MNSHPREIWRRSGSAAVAIAIFTTGLVGPTIGQTSAVVAVSLAAGPNHTLAALSDGTVWSWGANGSGQLGDGTNIDRWQPTQVKSLDHIVAVAAGTEHSAALRRDGTVWTWGSNTRGQLGDGTTKDGSRTPVQVGGLNRGAAIVAGANHNLVLNFDGSVWAWGGNTYGQVGDSTTNDKYTPAWVGLSGATAIAAGTNHSLALMFDGSMRSWGFNQFGQLGDGTRVNSYTPAAFNAEFIYDASTGQFIANPKYLPSLNGIAAIAAGANHSVAMKRDGSVWTWGNNIYNQLGYGTADSETPTQISGAFGAAATVAAGGDTSLALTSDGTMWLWGGAPTSNNCTVGGGFSPSPGSSPVGGIGRVNSAVTSGGQTFTVLADGSIWAWGRNCQGQLGDRTNVSRAVPVAVLGLPGIAPSSPTPTPDPAPTPQIIPMPIPDDTLSMDIAPVDSGGQTAEGEASLSE